MNKNDVFTAPIRLCYHRLCHYNSLVDPYKPTIGVGLGLPGFNPGSADRNQVKQAVKNSEADLVEKAMLEDKIKATGNNKMPLMLGDHIPKCFHLCSRLGGYK